MQRILILLCLFAGIAHGAACPVTVGTITLNPTIVRASGVSPLLVFFDASNTIDTSIVANTSVFQNDVFTWNFSDPGAVSGQGVWTYGSKSAFQSKNIATGGVAAHMYLTPGVDKTYTPTVSVISPSGTKASCSLSVSVQDPSNAFPGTATKCVFNTAVGSGCPAGAAQITTSALATGMAALANNTRVLFKCGDTFTGRNVPGVATKFSVGAYGGCENTQTNRPIWRFTGASDGTSGILQATNGSTVPGDGRWSDIAFDGAALAARYCWEVIGNQIVAYQQTLYNLSCAAAQSNYSWSQGAQMGIIASVATNMQDAIGTFINFNGNGNNLYAGNVIPNIDYQSILGSKICGTGDTGTGGDENLRISVSKGVLVENNDICDSNSVGAVLKLFNSNSPGTFNVTITNGNPNIAVSNADGRIVQGNFGTFNTAIGGIGTGTCNSGAGVSNCYFVVNATPTSFQISLAFNGTPITPSAGGSTTYNGPGSQPNFIGTYGQFVMVTDNRFFGKSGAQLVEISPQNTCNDERFRDVVVERNLFQEQFDNLGNFLLLSGERETLRDNVFWMGTGFIHPSFFNIQYAGRTGTTGGGCSFNPITVQTTQFAQIYNNTAEMGSFRSPQEFICLDNFQLGGNSGSTSFVANNLYHCQSCGTGATVIDNKGAGNTIGTNTSNANVPNDPVFKNFSGTFSQMSDFKPTTNVSGGTSQPGVIIDAIGVNWAPTWALGAVKP